MDILPRDPYHGSLEKRNAGLGLQWGVGVEREGVWEEERKAVMN